MPGEQFSPQTSAIWAIVVMLAVLALCYFATRFIARAASRSPMTRGSHMRILDRIAVSRDKMIILLEAGGKVYLVGITSQAINILGTMDEISELPPLEAQAGLASYVREVMERNLAKRAARKNKDVFSDIEDRETGGTSFTEMLGKNSKTETADRKGREFTEALDAMDEKMKARAGKLKGRRGAPEDDPDESKDKRDGPDGKLEESKAGQIAVGQGEQKGKQSDLNGMRDKPKGKATGQMSIRADKTARETGKSDEDKA